MSDVDDQIVRARAAMERIAGEHSAKWGAAAAGHPRRFRRTARTVARKVRTAAIADVLILIAAVVIGLVAPLGIFGFLAVVLLLMAVNIAILFAPTGRPPSEEKLRQVDLKALPAQTERWLEAQRLALPAPAVRLVDQISQRLETLTPQLARVDDNTDAAFEVRKLVGEQLPAFIGDYGRVPPSLRTVERNGRSPDAELVDGLKLIDRQIGEMTQRLAESDLDQLQTRGRFLELKYRGENQD